MGIPSSELLLGEQLLGEKTLNAEISTQICLSLCVCVYIYMFQES